MWVASDIRGGPQQTRRHCDANTDAAVDVVDLEACTHSSYVWLEARLHHDQMNQVSQGAVADFPAMAAVAVVADAVQSSRQADICILEVRVLDHKAKG